MGNIERHLLGLVASALRRAGMRAEVHAQIDDRHGSGIHVTAGGMNFNLIISEITKEKR